MVLLKDRHLVAMGGYVGHASASCLIYERWSSLPVSMNMNTTRRNHTAAVLDGKNFVLMVGCHYLL